MSLSGAGEVKSPGETRRSHGIVSGAQGSYRWVHWATGSQFPVSLAEGRRGRGKLSENFCLTEAGPPQMCSRWCLRRLEDIGKRALAGDGCRPN